MITVFLVDGKTRLLLPDTAWGFSVVEKLTAMGHYVQRTQQVPEPDLRDEAELQRRDELLDSTGL